MAEPIPVVLDHLVFACSDLAEGVDLVTERFGVAPVAGGRHPAWGTRNALLGLEHGAYLEVVAPDPSVPPPAGGRGLGVDGAGTGRLVTWAARPESIATTAHRSAALGIDLGAVGPGSRRTADGGLLAWVMTDPRADRLSGVVPFLLDWGESRHPAASLAAAGRVAGSVVTLRIRHPEPDRVRAALDLIAVAPSEASTPVAVDPGPPSIEAILLTPRGEVVLR
jgi:hypothetical protein